ncbi:MAG: FAD-dependent oxidoreductase [Proteobacteria bacterium]|nr:FAD-dependent oxidoreductase [Pseudomonadota bacterium]
MPEDIKKSPNSETSLSRRQFIKTNAAAAAAGAASMALPGCSGKSVLDEEYPDIPENKVNLPPNGKSVLILGGGFGGMHAACELLDRGFDVTVIEKSNMLGGKLKSWRDPSFGVPPENDPDFKGYPRDHGAHAVWGFYNNLREFMGRHGYRLYKIPREDTTMYNFLNKDGQENTIGFPPPNLPGMFGEIQRCYNLLNDLSRFSAEEERIGKYLLKMMSFDFDDVNQRMYLDSISFPEWARSIGMPDKLIYRLFGPLSEMAMFDHIDNTSALYTLMLLNLAGGSYDDMCIDIFMHPPGETYVAPIEQYIKSRGGKIIYNTPVIRVNHVNGKIKSVLAGDEGSVDGSKMWKCRICGSVFSAPSKPNRCPVCGAPSSQIFALTSGPPKEYTADYYVVAMDSPGAKQVIAKSNLTGSSYFDNIMKLEKTSVFPVNLWYSKCTSWEKRFPGFMDFMPSGFKLLGVTLNWAHDGILNGKKACSQVVVPDYQQDYVNDKIAVIETQIADTKRVENMSDDMIARLVHEELKIVMPDLPDPTDYYVNRWDTYSPQLVGYEAIRPPIQSPVDNLFFIGDWVKTDHLSVYMEKTNVSAKMVTNILVEKAGLKKGKIKILQSGSPNKLLDLCRVVFSIYP